MAFGLSRSHFDTKIVEVKVPNPLVPDPYNFLVEKISQHDEFMIVKVKYYDCKTYEGRKILVFNGLALEDLVNMHALDPHFSEEKPELSPVARFVPTDEGWEMAKRFVFAMNKKGAINVRDSGKKQQRSDSFDRARNKA